LRKDRSRAAARLSIPSYHASMARIPALTRKRVNEDPYAGIAKRRFMQATPLFNKKSAFAPLHSDARAAAVLLNKLDASLLQRGHQSSPRFGTTSYRPILSLQSSDCRLGNTGGGGQIALRPRKQSARSLHLSH
jgi:hypothetical protein